MAFLWSCWTFVKCEVLLRASVYQVSQPLHYWWYGMNHYSYLGGRFVSSLHWQTFNSILGPYTLDVSITCQSTISLLFSFRKDGGKRVWGSGRNIFSWVSAYCHQSLGSSQDLFLSVLSFHKPFTPALNFSSKERQSRPHNAQGFDFRQPCTHSTLQLSCIQLPPTPGPLPPWLPAGRATALYLLSFESMSRF